MVENPQAISTDANHQAPEKKEKNATKARRKRSKSAGKHKSSKKEINSDKNDLQGNADADKGTSNAESKMQGDAYDHVDNNETSNGKDESKRDGSPQNPVKLPRQSKLYPDEKSSLPIVSLACWRTKYTSLTEFLLCFIVFI